MESGYLELGQLEVGKPYPATIPPADGCFFDMTDNGATLLIFMKSPTSKELESIKNGKIKFALTVKEGIIFILYKFGSLGWRNVPYTIHRSGHLTMLEDLGDNLGFTLSIILVDTAKRTVEALKLIGLPHRFSKALQEAMVEQDSTEYDTAEYDLKLNDIYANYTTKDLLKMALVSQSIGEYENYN